MSRPSPLQLIGNRYYVPWARIPAGELVELPGRGTTYVTDTPGPGPDAPVIVLLHALACTGLLTWYPSIGRLSERFRVLTLDQRWHGRGIRTDDFSLVDCADDVAALLDVREIDHAVVAGYSMGSIIAQRVWRQHPERVAGLVLCATTDRFQASGVERLFFSSLGVAAAGARGWSKARTDAHAARAVPGALDPTPAEVNAWALREVRSTSPWAVAQATAALGRHHSRPWLGRIDVPTAVVTLRKDKIIPHARQLRLASAIPGATVHSIDAGHAACLLETESFVPAVVEAAATVRARSRDLRGR